MNQDYLQEKIIDYCRRGLIQEKRLGDNPIYVKYKYKNTEIYKNSLEEDEWTVIRYNDSPPFHGIIDRIGCPANKAYELLLEN